jgi:hypothetical protein
MTTCLRNERIGHACKKTCFRWHLVNEAFQVRVVDGNVWADIAGQGYLYYRILIKITFGT